MVAKKSRSRRSAEETRRLLVKAGVEQLEREGVDAGVEHLTLEAACAVADVPRSSSHAAWSLDDDYSPQALYQRTVLHEWVTSREVHTFSAAAEKALAHAYETRGDQISRHEIIRVLIQAALHAGLSPGRAVTGTGFNSTDMAIKHALASQPDELRDPEIVQWVREAETKNRAERVEDSYRPLAALLEMQPRPEYGDAAYSHLALAVASLTEGITMREILLPELGVADEPIREVADGEAPATLLAVCVESLVDTFFLPASDDQAVAD